MSPCHRRGRHIVRAAETQRVLRVAASIVRSRPDLATILQAVVRIHVSTSVFERRRTEGGIGVAVPIRRQDTITDIVGTSNHAAESRPASVVGSDTISERLDLTQVKARVWHFTLHNMHIRCIDRLSIGRWQDRKKRRRDEKEPTDKSRALVYA